MKNKKILLHKFTSLFLALIMLFQIPLGSFNIFALDNNITTTIESSESTITSETSEESSTTTEESNSSEITPTDIGIISVENDEIEDIDNWEISIVFYDQDAEEKTPLTEVSWNPTTYNETKNITLQLNIKNTNTITTYQPGELSVKVDSLTAMGGFGYSTAKLAADKKNSTSKIYDWSYEFVGINSKDSYDIASNCDLDQYFLFTNNNVIEAGTNFESSLEIVFVGSPEGIYNNSNYKLKATLGDITSNELTATATSAKWTYYSTIYTSKLSSLDGITCENALDYYWVKYSMNLNANKPVACRRAYDIVARYTLSPSNIVYDSYFNQLSPVDENYTYEAKISSSSSQVSSYIIVGYPKSEFQGQTITNTVTYHGRYYPSGDGNDQLNKWPYIFPNQEKEYLTEKSVDVVLDNFAFSYTGNLYDIYKTYRHLYTYGTNFQHSNHMIPYYSNLSYNSLISNEHTTFIEYEFWPTIKYTGTTMNVRIYDDIVGITNDSGGYTQLNDSEYHFINITIPRFKNGNGQYYQDDEYEFKLYVRYANAETYTQYGDIFKCNQQTITFLENEHIVGWYIDFLNLKESLISDVYSHGIYASIEIFQKENIATEGYVYNFSGLQIYFKDENDNLILQNEPELDSYATIATQLNIATHDQAVYGHYMQRDYVASQYGEDKISVAVSKNIINDSSITDYENEKFIREWQSNFSLGIETSYDYIDGVVFYDLLPKGMELESSPEDIINSITPYENNYVLIPSQQYLKEHTTLTITENWNNTSRTHVKIKIDLSENPIDVKAISKYFAENHNYTSVSIFSFKIKAFLTFDNCLEYGPYFDNYIYGELITNKDKPYTFFDNDTYWTFDSDGKLDSVLDNGTRDHEAYDINENGLVSERLFIGGTRAYANIASGSYQDLTTYVETDKTNYTKTMANVSPNNMYNYKLRVRSGANNLTNLIIYDNLEEAQKEKEHWKGEFQGINTSYAEKQGFIIKPYYSLNPEAGTLYNDDGTINSDWNEYFQHQEPVTTNGLSITFNSKSYTYHSSDYLCIYYYYEGQLYKTTNYYGTSSYAIAGKTITIPSTDFYIYWYSNSSSNSEYGFSIDKIVPIEVNTTYGTVTSTLPSIAVTEINGNIYPETKHYPYNNSESILWHYTYSNSPYITTEEGTNLSDVKSIAFEFLDSKGNPAILENNEMTYVLINMKAPTNENTLSLARNNCWTQWNALDESGNFVDFIDGINSNTTKVSIQDHFNITVDKIWDDYNNKYNLRPQSIDIILKKYGQEIERKQITTENLSVTFENLYVDDFDNYTIEEETLFTYISSTPTLNETNEHYEITNTLNENILLNISGTKTWENDTEDSRPESITINLLQDRTKIETTTTNVSKNWEYTFSTVSAYRPDGSLYEYTIEEVPVDRYLATYKPLYNGVEITFSNDCYTYNSLDYLSIYYNYNNKIYVLGSYYGSALAGKVIELPTTDFYIYWHTSNTSRNYYGFAIDSIVNKEVTTNPSISTTSLPSYDIEEVTYDNYPESAHSPYDMNANKIWHYTLQTWDITNTRNSIDISGVKTWENDTVDLRPESITIKLLQDGTVYKTTTVTADDNWKYTFTDVPEFKTDGSRYVYTVEELPVDRYIPTYKYNGVEITFSDNCYTYNYSDYLYIYYNYNNTMYSLGAYYGSTLAGKVIELPTTDFYIYWHTSNTSRNYYGFAIDSIVNKEVTTNPSSTISSLPSYDIEEVTYDDYPESAHSPYDVNANKIWHYTLQTWDITNTRNSIDISGVKTWEGDTENQRPESITIKLLQDGIEYTTITTTADDNWEYSFLNIPEFRSDGTSYEYSVEEIPVNGYTTKYGKDTNGVAITFNNQSLTEGANWDYVEIYYVLEGTIYKLGKWGGKTTGSSQCLAGKTIEVPSKDFYLYWRTDSSVCNYYGFSIDSIVPTNVEHLSTTSTGTLPSYTIEELSGSTYPDSAFDIDHPHGNYGTSVNKLWHYTCTDASLSDTPQPGIFNIINIKSSFSIEINKKDFFTKETLSNVSFNLYKLVDTDTTHDHGMATENNCWDSVGTFTTDENGLLTLDNLSADTIYGIVETTPDGYVVPNNTYWKMTVDSDQSITFETVGNTDDFYDRYGWTGYRLDIEASDDEYVLYNIPEFRTVEATKRIKASEINFYNGNPTFLFKLTGTDVSNTVRTYYRGIEFTEEYVNANTDNDGYITITVVFEDLIKGTYTLSEEEISRYSIETISDVENGTASNTIVTFDLEDNTSGEATFTNKKYEFRWFSHNDFIVNTIKTILDDEE